MTVATYFQRVGGERGASMLAVLDPWLLGAAIGLAGLGLVMVESASLGIAERNTGQVFYFFERQVLFLLAGIAIAWGVLQVRLETWEKMGTPLLFAGLAILLVVLVPGVGRTVNGATRWLPFGAINVQVSEPAKLFIILYLSGYLVRRVDEVRSRAIGFLKPMSLVVGAVLLLLLEPDFGASVVLITSTLGMMFLAGARLWQFGLLLGSVVAGLALLAISSPYRMERLTGFLNPWADPYDSGFQLTQALIAIGRGEWFGVGLGAGVQKLFYLPEAHTDFLFAVLAEELGMFGVGLVIALFAILVWRAFVIARLAGQVNHAFAHHLAHGLGLWLGFQAFVNMGVNMGVLPTKGLTLPLMSYGGSSLMVMCSVIALLLRIDLEVAGNPRGARKEGP